MNHTAPQGSIMGTDFPVGNINAEACEGLLKGVFEAFLFAHQLIVCRSRAHNTRAVLAGGHQTYVSRGLPISLELSAVECEG